MCREADVLQSQTSLGHRSYCCLHKQTTVNITIRQLMSRESLCLGMKYIPLLIENVLINVENQCFIFHAETEGRSR